MGSHGFDCRSSALSWVDGWKNTGYGLPGTDKIVRVALTTLALMLTCAILSVRKRTEYVLSVHNKT